MVRARRCGTGHVSTTEPSDVCRCRSRPAARAGDAATSPDLIVRVADAKARLSQLIQRAERVVIARGDTLVIELSPIARSNASPIGIFERLGIAFDLDEVYAATKDDWTEEDLDAFEGDLENELR